MEGASKAEGIGLELDFELKMNTEVNWTAGSVSTVGGGLFKLEGQDD